MALQLNVTIIESSDVHCTLLHKQKSSVDNICDLFSFPVELQVIFLAMLKG